MAPTDELLDSAKALSRRERHATARLLSANANPTTELGFWKLALGAALITTIAIERGEPPPTPNPIDELRTSTARLSPGTREMIAVAFTEMSHETSNVGRWFARVSEYLARPVDDQRGLPPSERPS